MGCAFPIELPGCGQLRVGIKQPGNDQGVRQRTLFTGLVLQQGEHAQLRKEATGGGHMAMRKRPLHLELLREG